MDDKWKSKAAQKAAALIVEGRATAAARTSLVDRLLELRGEVEARELRLLEVEQFDRRRRSPKDDDYIPEIVATAQAELDAARAALQNAKRALESFDEGKIRLGIEAARLANVLKLPVGV